MDEQAEVVPQMEGAVVPPKLSTNPQVIPKELKIKCLVDGCDMSFPVVAEFEEHTKKAHTKHAGGRPCEFCRNKDKYLSLAKAYVESGQQEKPKILFIIEMALKMGITRDNLWEWRNKKKEDGSLEHPEFSNYVKDVEALQELRLQQRLLGRYNPTGAIFLLKTKHKYIETEKQILAGDSHEPLEIIITEEKKKTYE